MNYYGTFWAPTYENNCWCSPNYLAHYGILGMRWGIRRYQNRDGSLTTLGRIRQNRENRKQQKEEANKWRKINKMSSEDRKKAIEEEHLKYVSALKERKNEFIKNAKENDQYLIDYLEVRPDSIAEGDLKSRINDYEKYLDDPDKYLRDRYTK